MYDDHDPIVGNIKKVVQYAKFKKTKQYYE